MKKNVGIPVSVSTVVSKTSISSTFSAGCASLRSPVLLEALDDNICYFFTELHTYV
jgi:hypothetical protein